MAVNMYFPPKTQTDTADKELKTNILKAQKIQITTSGPNFQNKVKAKTGCLLEGPSASKWRGIQPHDGPDSTADRAVTPHQHTSHHKHVRSHSIAQHTSEWVSVAIAAGDITSQTWHCLHDNSRHHVCDRAVLMTVFTVKFKQTPHFINHTGPERSDLYCSLCPKPAFALLASRGQNLCLQHPPQTKQNLTFY